MRRWDNYEAAARTVFINTCCSLHVFFLFLIPLYFSIILQTPSILLLSLASHQVDLNLKIPGRNLNIVEGRITLGIHDAVSVRRDDEHAFLHSLAEYPPDVTLRERRSHKVFKNKTQDFSSKCLSNNNRSQRFPIQSGLNDIRGKTVADGRQREDAKAKEKGTVHKPDKLGARSPNFPLKCNRSY